MAITKKEEARALSSDEQELVGKSHHPDLQDLPDRELSNLVPRYRARQLAATGVNVTTPFRAIGFMARTAFGKWPAGKVGWHEAGRRAGAGG